MSFFFNFNQDIPEEFYSSKTHQPHNECSICGNLLNRGMYFIEKAYQRTHDKTEFQLTFEYAICEDCKKDMMVSISKESFQNIQKFAMEMGDVFDFGGIDNDEINKDYLMTHCMATGKSIDELDEYHLLGIFSGDKMMQFPMLYGDSFIEEYSELLSEETKGFFDDLFNDITIIPPALAKILDDEKPKRPVLI